MAVEDVWAEIAARTHEAETTGIKVCLCEDGDDCATECRQSDYRWCCKEFWWGEAAEFRAAGFYAKVTDRDGDYTDWFVDFRGKRLAEGDTHVGDHFRQGIICAEIVIRWNARKFYRRSRASSNTDGE